MRTLTQQEEDFLALVLAYPTCGGSCETNDDTPLELQSVLMNRGLIVVEQCPFISDIEHPKITGTGIYVLNLVRLLRVKEG